MGRWARAGVLAVVLLAGCGGPADTLVLDRPLPSNRFHPVARPGTPPKGGGLADPAQPPRP
jgi:hypothetical protein